ncbi:Nn.00g038850.m01.CDS01 [Neocucurbitaria sp. VM-36]
MSSYSSTGKTQTSRSPTAIVGCLLDVSNSMRNVLETGTGDGRATERLRAVLRAALKLARAEQQQSPNALMFVGAFGLNNKHTPVVDLCSLVDSLLDSKNDPEDTRTGYECLIALANEENVPRVAKYIREKLTEEQARIIYGYLRRKPQEIQEFINVIPAPEQFRNLELASIGASMSSPLLRYTFGRKLDRKVEDSEILKLARRICDEWLLDFKDLTVRRVSDVVPLLERLDNHPSLGSSTKGRILLDHLRPHLYGWTPMRRAMRQALDVFQKHPMIEQRVLVMITDGQSTDGDPLPVANKLKQEKVTIAGVFLTADNSIPRRRLYDHSKDAIHIGQRTLFNMASQIAVDQHPIPVLSSMGWEVPSSGKCALYTTVCSSDALEEFCSVLLSAQFGETDALLDVLGRMDLDAFINDEHVRTRNSPQDQGQSPTCYAHAIAGVLHMAMLRVFDRDGGHPSIEIIRNRILKEFPPGQNGRNIEEVLKHAVSWYRPLRFRCVDEDGARQAVLRRRPVLATFRLSDQGWNAFSKHFQAPGTRTSVFPEARMSRHRFLTDGGGHAVVMVKCNPSSLTFLNSWGSDWGDNGSFQVENASTLEVKGAPDWARIRLYDIYWYEIDLTIKERQAYSAHIDEKVRSRATRHPSVFELEVQCPLCKQNAPIADFTGNVRSAKCPLCKQVFRTKPGHLVQAIYARAGLGDVV